MLETCYCLKLLPVYFDLLVDAAGVVCHQPGLLGTDLHALLPLGGCFASIADSAFVIFYGICHDPFQKYVEEDGWE